MSRKRTCAISSSISFLTSAAIWIHMEMPDVIILSSCIESRAKRVRRAAGQRFYQAKESETSDSKSDDSVLVSQAGTRNQIFGTGNQVTSRIGGIANVQSSLQGSMSY